MKHLISIIVPVYNRPEELRELLESLTRQTTSAPFEVVVVEDGSIADAEDVARGFMSKLDIQYFQKPNTGPGDSRNEGMRRAKGTFFVLVDSDCILPPDYLEILLSHLSGEPSDCVGGRDAAHPSFSSFQKAVSFCMTSPLTTGGLRGGEGSNRNFQPRSFNMGLSAEAFKASGGFGNIHPGEDPDLSLRLRQKGFRITYIPQWIVYHKRRINLRSFYKQVYRFGTVRPILNRWHPGSGKVSYWLPTLFSLGLLLACILPFVGSGPWRFLPIGIYGVYLLLIGCQAFARTRSIRVAFLSMVATPVQFMGYGLGFLKSQTLLTFSNKKPEALFPGFFFNR